MRVCVLTLDKGSRDTSTIHPHPGPSGGYDTKGAGFKGLGIGMTMLGIWTAYFFSGHYPSIVGAWLLTAAVLLYGTHVSHAPPTAQPPAPADPVLALGFLAVIIHGIINSEVALTKELNEKTPQMDADGVWRGGGPGQAAETRYVGGGVRVDLYVMCT